MTFIAGLLVTRPVYPSDDRRAAGSTAAMQIFLRAIARGYEPMTPSFAPAARRCARHLAACHRIAGRSRLDPGSTQARPRLDERARLLALLRLRAGRPRHHGGRAAAPAAVTLAPRLGRRSGLTTSDSAVI
jgi:hypothetical protein